MSLLTCLSNPASTKLGFKDNSEIITTVRVAKFLLMQSFIDYYSDNKKLLWVQG